MSRLACSALLLAALAPWQPALAFEVFSAPEHGLVVREAPGGAAIATLPPGYGPIETTGQDITGAWLRIGLAEQDGWVARDAVAPATVPLLDGDLLPEGLMCFGVEPNWSARLTAGGATIGDPGQEAMWSLDGIAPAEGRREGQALATLRRDEATALLLVRRAACSDGMSDRTHAWQADLLLPSDAGTAFGLRTGCCRLAADR